MTTKRKPGAKKAVVTVIHGGKVRADRLGRTEAGLCIYTRAIADEIVSRLEEGEPLAVICRTEGMPSMRTVKNWCDSGRDGFGERYEEARSISFLAIATRLMATARGLGKKYGGDSTGDVARDKLIVETDLKLLAKWDPKNYGDRSQVDVNATISLRRALDELT